MRMRIIKKEQNENEMSKKIRMRIIKKQQNENELRKNENENN